jgi:CDGSH-type Zn-finger protein
MELFEAKPNGPYLVKGPAKITVDGSKTETVDRPVIALCRCGGSKNKPFCDGTHSKAGFEAAGAKFEAP